MSSKEAEVGVKSTLEISRKTAISYISSRLQSCTDSQLEEMMETLYGEQLLYNYKVMSKNESSFPYSSHDRLARS
jgi:hypothetical protein